MAHGSMTLQTIAKHVLKMGLRAPTNHYKTAVKTHKTTLKNHSKNDLFKNGNFVARLLFEAIFERASQKEKK